MLNLTEQVKKMSIDEAIKVANNVKEEYKKDPQRVAVALLKLQSIESLIGDALKNVSTEMVKTLKKNNEILEISTDVKIKNKEGIAEEKSLEINIKAFDTAKNEIDFESLKEDNGVVIEDDPNDPCVKHIRALNPAIFSLLKAPTIAGNPTAFEAAATNDANLLKYKTTKTTSKYAIEVELVAKEN